MELLPLADDHLIELAASWLSEPRIYQWLDFGAGSQRITAPLLKVMVLKGSHVIRAFTADDTGQPIGLVALGDVNLKFHTAMLWAVLGERGYSAKGYAHRACSAILSLGFDEYKLDCVNAWAVECNHASLRALRRLNFRSIGRQRRCHQIDGQVYDRLWFDLLANEHREQQERSDDRARADLG